MVEVFKTNITDLKTAKALIRQLQRQLPGAKLSFDLEDCDRILRVISDDCPVNVTERFMNSKGYLCSVLTT